MNFTRRVLVADDNDDIAEAIADVLHDEGYEVLRAPNGKEALELLARCAPVSIILLDLMMPVMDGFQFREAQLLDPRFAEIPVLVLSADRLIQEKMTQLRARGHLVKPFSPELLIRAIREHARGP